LCCFKFDIDCQKKLRSCGEGGMEVTVIGALVGCMFVSSNVYAFGSGVQVQGVQVNPTLELTVKHDDNIASKETNKTVSSITILKPALEAVVGNDIHYASLGYIYEKGDYSSSKDDNYADSFTDFTYHNEPTSKQSFDFAASYVKSHDPRGSVPGVAASTTPDKWNNTEYNFNYGYGGQVSKLTLNAGLSKKRYETLRLTRLDTDIKNANATFFIPLSAKTSVLFELVFAAYDYKELTSRLDSNERTFYTGLTWEATAKTTGTIKLGSQNKSFTDPTQSSTSFFSWDATLGWSPLSYSVWNLGTSFKASESDGALGFVKAKNINLAWNHEWSQRLKHSVNLDFTNKSYSYAASRTDENTNIGLALNYDFNTWLDIETSYNLTKLSSTLLGTSYAKNEIALTFLGKL